jgi:hypothetical protein
MPYRPPNKDAKIKITRAVDVKTFYFPELRRQSGNFRCRRELAAQADLIKSLQDKVDV